MSNIAINPCLTSRSAVNNNKQDQQPKYCANLGKNIDNITIQVTWIVFVEYEFFG